MSGWKSFSLFDPTPEHKALREMTKNFAQREVEPQAQEFDRKEQFNLPLFQKLGEQGLTGLLIPEKWGGSGMDLTASVIVNEELSATDPGLCLAYLAHSVLCAYNIYRNGSSAQKDLWLPALCSGKQVGALAMSEPDCGTDARAMKTKAVKKNGKYILNGRKMWITNGSVDESKTPCDFLILYSQTEKGISAFVVEKGFPGFFVGQKIKDKLGMRASNTCELVFDNCEVPESHLLGEEGQGLLQMVRNLEVERITLAAMSLGIAGRCLEEMNRYGSKRESFGQPIRRFGQIQKHIAQSYGEYQSARAYTYETARSYRDGSGDQRIASENASGQRLNSDGAKLIAGQTGKNIADRAIQVLGGYGYVGEYQVERFWRDAKLLEIGGGTTEALEKNITKDLDGITQI